MIKIDFQKFIQDHYWFGWYWTVKTVAKEDVQTGLPYIDFVWLWQWDSRYKFIPKAPRVTQMSIWDD